MSRDLRELLHDTAEPPTRPVEAARIVDEAGRRTTRHRIGVAVTAAAVILAGVVVLPQLLDGGWAPRIGGLEPAGPPVGERTVFASGQIPSGEWTASVWREQPQGTDTICIEVRHGMAQDLGCRAPIDPGEIMDVGPSGWLGDAEGNERPTPAVYGQVAAGVAEVVVVLDDGTETVLRPHPLGSFDVAVIGHAFPADRYPVQIRALGADGSVLQRTPVALEPGGRVAIPTQMFPVGEDHPGMAALLVGRLRGDADMGCLWIEPGEEYAGLGNRVSVEWPYGYTAAFDPIRLYDADGHVVAREGDLLELGGGDTDSIDFCQITDNAWSINNVEVRDTS